MREKSLKNTGLSSAPGFSKEHCLLQGLTDSPVCLSGKSNIYMKMSVEHWWNDTDRGKPLCPPEISHGPV